MTRELPKPVAAPLGWVICGAINAADQYLKDGAK